MASPCVTKCPSAPSRKRPLGPLGPSGSPAMLLDCHYWPASRAGCPWAILGKASELPHPVRNGHIPSNGHEKSWKSIKIIQKSQKLGDIDVIDLYIYTCILYIYRDVIDFQHEMASCWYPSNHWVTLQGAKALVGGLNRQPRLTTWLQGGLVDPMVANSWLIHG